MMPPDHAAMCSFAQYEVVALVRRAVTGNPKSFPPPITEIVGKHPWTAGPFGVWMTAHLGRAIWSYRHLRRVAP